MTRSVTIVNTSNWDNEDYIIQIPGREDVPILSPGESLTFVPHSDSPVRITPDNSRGEPKPFSAPKVDGTRTKTVQLIPKVKVEFGAV